MYMLEINVVGFTGNLSQKDLILIYVLVQPVQYCHKGNVLNPWHWHFTSLPDIVNIISVHPYLQKRLLQYNRSQVWLHISGYWTDENQP